jgi:hypothetical protein
MPPNDLARVLQAILLEPTLASLPGEARSVSVATVRRREARWTGPTPANFTLVPNKPPLNFEGSPNWAEFIILRLLERDGWRGVWVKNWGGRAFWSDIGRVAERPEPAAAKFREIESRAGSTAGCWDVFAWRDDGLLFLESKQRSKDRLRQTQLAWLDAALACGVPLSSFAIVEWFT